MTENIHKIVSACITIAGLGKRGHQKQITPALTNYLSKNCEINRKLKEKDVLSTKMV